MKRFLSVRWEILVDVEKQISRVYNYLSIYSWHEITEQRDFLATDNFSVRAFLLLGFLPLFVARARNISIRFLPSFVTLRRGGLRKKKITDRVNPSKVRVILSGKLPWLKGVSSVWEMTDWNIEKECFPFLQSLGPLFAQRAFSSLFTLRFTATQQEIGQNNTSKATNTTE